MHEAGQRALAQAQRLQHLAPLLQAELGGLGLELDAHAQHLGPARQLGLDRGEDRRHVVELVLAHVDHGQHRAVGEQEVGPQQRRRLGVEVAAVERHALGQHRLGRLERGHLVGQRPVALGRLAPLGHLVLDRLQVGQRELQLDHPQVLQRVGRDRGRRRRRRPAARRRRRRPRGCWPGSGCPGPRPCWPPRPGRRCRRTARWRAPRCGWPTWPPARRAAGRAPWPRPRWGRGWRRRRARPARRRRRGRCTATTCRRWGGRRTRTVPPREATEPWRPAIACGPMEREIVVRGTGEARTLPDLARLRIEVTADHRDQDEAYEARAELAASGGRGAGQPRARPSPARPSPSLSGPAQDPLAATAKQVRDRLAGQPHHDRRGRRPRRPRARSWRAWSRRARRSPGRSGRWRPTNPAHDEARRAAAEDARLRAQAYAEALGPRRWARWPGWPSPACARPCGRRRRARAPRRRLAVAAAAPAERRAGRGPDAAEMTVRGGRRGRASSSCDRAPRRRPRPHRLPARPRPGRGPEGAGLRPGPRRGRGRGRRRDRPAARRRQAHRPGRHRATTAKVIAEALDGEVPGYLAAAGGRDGHPARRGRRACGPRCGATATPTRPGRTAARRSRRWPAPPSPSATSTWC